MLAPIRRIYIDFYIQIGVNKLNCFHRNVIFAFLFNPLLPAIQQLRNLYRGNISRPVRLEIPENRLDWRPVYGLGSLMFVHAALWKGDSVRISVIKRPHARETNILCILWYTPSQESNFSIVKASVVDLLFYGHKHACAYIKCPVRKKKGTKKNIAPLYVGLALANYLTAKHRILIPVENRNMDPKEVSKQMAAAKVAERSVLIKVSANTSGKTSNKTSSTTPNKPRVVEFTVCVPAMFQYNNAAQLVEKLEMVRLLGAGRVVLYKTSVKPNVEAVLRLYTSEWAAGRETLELVVHSWRLPPAELHYRGQLAAVDDCLHRYGWLSRYMVFDDLDELIIPLRHANWSQLIAERERLHPGRAAFMFRCSVMNADHSSPADGFRQDAIRYGSSVLSLTLRDDYVFPPIKRSKLIINPRKVDAMGVHNIDKVRGYMEVIPLNQGMLYHYRWPVRLCESEVKDNRVASKFGKRLLVRLKSVWSRLEGVALGWKKPMPKTNSTRPTCFIKARLEKMRKKKEQLEVK